AHPALRWAGGAGGRVVLDPGGPDLRTDRAERGRQDDVVKRRERAGGADERSGGAGRCRSDRAAGPWSGWDGHRPDVPERPPLWRSDGARERDGRVPPPAAGDDRGVAVRAAARETGGAAGPGGDDGAVGAAADRPPG